MPDEVNERPRTVGVLRIVVIRITVAPGRHVGRLRVEIATDRSIAAAIVRVASGTVIGKRKYFTRLLIGILPPHL